PDRVRQCARLVQHRRGGVARDRLANLASQDGHFRQHRPAQRAIPARFPPSLFWRARRLVGERRRPVSGVEIGAVGIVGLVLCVLAGMNVMVALGLVGTLGLGAIVGSNGTLGVLRSVFYDTTHSFHFSVIPMFL